MIEIGESLEEIEKQYILKILEINNWVKLRTAKILGISRRTLYNKLEKYDQCDVENK